MSTPVENLVERLHAKCSGKGWIAKCPAHDDQKPSLSINEGADGRALVKCHAGCSTDDVLATLGLTRRDLFPATLQRQSGNGARSTLNWRGCVEAFTDKHLERLAKWRG
jgi:putative DNA primase/helicase